MASKKISQYDARRYKKEAEDLRGKLHTVKYRTGLADHYGVHIDTISVTNTEKCIVHTAKLCKKILVIVPVENEDKIRVFAVDP